MRSLLPSSWTKKTKTPPDQDPASPDAIFSRYDEIPQFRWSSSSSQGAVRQRGFVLAPDMRATTICVSQRQQDQEENDDEDNYVFKLSPLTCPGADDGSKDPEDRGQGQQSEDELDDSEPPSVFPMLTPVTGNGVQSLQSHRLTLRIFVGTWNMAAYDPFAGPKGQYIGDDVAAHKLIEFLPKGYDIYVLGTQEKVSKHVHKAVLARLNTMNRVNSQLNDDDEEAYEHHGVQFMRMDLTPDERGSSKKPFETSKRELRAESFGLTSSGVSASSMSNIEFSAAYGTTDSMSRPTKKKKMRKHKKQEVKGRGDGAFLTSKTTSLAVYHAVHLEPLLEVAHIGAHKFSFKSGSKGGLAVMLRAGAEQTITFANCHLEANRPALRRQQLQTLAVELPRAMGLPLDLDLTNCSDHVVWMGDFNYRIHSLDGVSVLNLLATGRHMELHDRYDSMQSDLAELACQRRLREATKWPTFYPTYKKKPHRNRVSTLHDPNWPQQVYRVMYREPIYKGGRTKARVPGWCDRILFCSAPQWKRTFSVEAVQYDSHDDENNASGLCENYRSVNDALRESDHSPVFCTFLLSVPHPNALQR